MIAPRTRYYQLPPVVTHPIDGRWFVIQPIARTNLITNSSFETATTSWSGIAGSVARSTTYQFHGAYSLAVTPTSSTTDGAVYLTVALTSGTTYAYSCKFRGQAGLKYKLAIETTGASELSSYRFTATGRWQWVWGFYKETSSNSRQLTLRKDGQNNTTVFYIDGVQVEATEASNVYPTTFISGDEQGFIPSQSPPAYIWNGTPHASTSSRSGQTRAGGRVIPFSRYGFILSAIVGLGLAQPNNVLTPYAQIDGAYYQRTQKPPREFQIAGRFSAGSLNRLMQQRGGLASLFDRDVTGLDQPLALLYEPTDPCEQPSGYTLYLPALYAGGLDGQMDNHHAEQASIAFTLKQPTITAQQEEGASLSVQSSLSDVDYIAERSAVGLWSALGTAPNNNITSLLYARNNLLYAAGAFTTIGGTAANGIASWNGSAWSALSTGVNARVEAMAVNAAGTLYVVGIFTSPGNSIASWNGAVWSALGSGLNSDANGVAVAPNGDVYAGGLFTTAGGGAANRAAVWNGSTWAALGSGLGAGGAQTVAIGPDGHVYFGGNFTTAGGSTANRVAKWNPTTSTWSALGSGMNGAVETLAFGPDGTLYAGGSFTTADGNTANRVAKWNGTSWTPMGTGVDAIVNQLTVLADGRVVAGGNFTTANGVPLPGGLAFWTGGAWTSADITLSTAILAVDVSDDGKLAIAPNGTTVPTPSAANTTVTNTGTAKAYPTLVIKGPTSGTSRIYQIVNYTTGRAVYFNYTMNVGETATFCFDPQNLRFISDFQGNLQSKVLSGSTEADFFLQPGANVISFFSASSTVTATLYWHPAFASLDDATYQRQ